MEQKITVPKGCKIESVEHDDNEVVIMFSEDKKKEVRNWEYLIGKQIPSSSKWIDDEGEMMRVGGKFGLLYKNVYIDEKHAKSALAMAQISQLMPYYGGAITYEEWSNTDIEKYVINRCRNSIEKDMCWTDYEFLAFHVKEQRDDFFKNNYQLVKDYLMI